MSIDQNNFLISEKSDISRIDKILAKKFDSKSRSYFQYLLNNGCVFVNNKKVKKSFVPKLGDEIEVFFQALQHSELIAEDIPLDILYEDEHILAINKPAGMVTHPGCGNWTKTFVNALLFHCKDLINIDDDIRPGIVHRLDKDTSGVLLAAKTKKAQENLIHQFKDRKIIKKYLAITLGHPKNQLVNAPITRNPIKRKEMFVLPGGKESITDFKTLAFTDKLALVLASPKTGRTHQIRVHLKYVLNAPILGDVVYGNTSSNKHYNVSRQLLHAYRLSFTHPINKQPMKITAPIAEDFKKIIKIFS